jgi:uncharacterized repeat protein (TIGR01451 family)
MRRISVSFCLLLFASHIVQAGTLPQNFQESTVFSGLVYPTVVKFASDGRIFVAEKSGLIKVFSSLTATAPTIVADLRPQVHDFWDRGLLGMELDPAFPTRPYVYVLYTLDKNPGDPSATVPTWGDTCPTPPGANGAGCPVLGRVSRLDVSAPWPVQGTEKVLLEGFGQQYPSHSVGGLSFGPDGALYVSAGEGAHFFGVDYGQFGGSAGPGPGQQVPVNPLADPPGGLGFGGVPPTARGGALRAQSLRRPAGEPVSLDGTLLRIDPETGAALPDNPLIAAPDANAKRIVAYGFRNPFRFALRPGTSEVWIGDVGWSSFDEINRVDISFGVVPNFGWPCYEGAGPQPAYQAAGLNSCALLYAQNSVRPPYFAYPLAGPVISGETCPTGTSSISGLAFYTSGTYPGMYHGALFFTDWARRCIWAMLPDGTGTPSPGSIVPFATGLAGGSVHLEIGPGGDIFYVDFDLGRIQRVRYFGGNQPPIVHIEATPPSGNSPLSVQFDASASSDPEGGALTFAWDLDGDGEFDDSTLSNPTWIFASSGQHIVRVLARDPQGTTASAQKTVFADNNPPAAVITSPLPSLLWKVGQPIAFAGTGTDPEEGVLPPSAFHWTLQMHHCPSGCHVHVIQSWAGFSAGSFSAPDHEYPSWLELTLTVTDMAGLSSTASVALQPRTVVLNLESNPSGLMLSVGSEAVMAPFSRTVIAGSSVTVGASSPQSIAGQSVAFSAWSDGGAASHVVVAPEVQTTLVATFRTIADLTLNASTSSPTITERGRIVVTATVGNAGPDIATAVQLVAQLPPGTTLVSTSPTNICSLSGSALTCGLGSLAPTASSMISLTLRPTKIGPWALGLVVTSSNVDSNPLNNATTMPATVAPLGDLNGDGKEDLIWQNSVSGAVAVWHMNGTLIAGGLSLTPDRGPDTNWRLAGLGDVNNDGKPDLFWWNQLTGVSEIWTMNGATRTALVPLPTVADTNWRMVAVGDVSGDGWSDILWRHRVSGQIALVTMAGTSPTNQIMLPAVSDQTWQIAGTSDLNADGKVDVIWHRTTDGSNHAWLMDSLAVSAGAALFSVADPTWLVGSFADLNGDRKPDLILRKQNTGANVDVFLDGVGPPLGGTALTTITDLTWNLIGPR